MPKARTKKGSGAVRSPVRISAHLFEKRIAVRLHDFEFTALAHLVNHGIKIIAEYGILKARSDPYRAAGY